MKRKWKGLILLGMALLAMLTLTGCGREKINLNDYVEVTFSGYNEVGIAETEIINVEEPMEATGYLLMMNAVEDNMELFGLTMSDFSENWENSTGTSKRFMKYVTGSFDKTSELSNGDTITFTWSVDEEKLEDLEKELKVNFVYSDKEIVVSGLEEAQPWDAFENVEVSFGGIAPNAYIESIKRSEEIPGLAYNPKKEGLEMSGTGLSNGDSVTICLSAPNDEDVTKYCMKYGKIPTALSKEFVVEGIDAYVTDLSQIPEDMMQAMDEQIRNTVAANAAATWAWKLADMEPLGNYLLVLKSGEENQLYYIYKITELNESTQETVSYYYYGRYHSVMLKKDGTLSVDLTDIVFPRGGYNWGVLQGEVFQPVPGGQHFVGYEDLESLFDAQVRSKPDFTYTSTVNQ